jgi:chaperonin GroES
LRQTLRCNSLQRKRRAWAGSAAHSNPARAGHPHPIEPPGIGRTTEEEHMNVKPLADRILVRRIEEQETRKGGIIIPDTAKEKPQEGEIVAVGPGRMNEEGKRIAMEVKKGDRVLIGKYSGTEVKIDGTEYVILREDDVLGILSAAKK